MAVFAGISFASLAPRLAPGRAWLAPLAVTVVAAVALVAWRVRIRPPVGHTAMRVFVRDAGTGVPNLEAGAIALPDDGQADLAADGRVLDRVVDQVGQSLEKLVPIPGYRGGLGLRGQAKSRLIIHSTPRITIAKLPGSITDF